MNDIFSSLLLAILSAFGGGPADDTLVETPPVPTVSCGIAREGGALVASAFAGAPVSGRYVLEVTTGPAKSRQKGRFAIAADGTDRLAVARLGGNAAATLLLTWEGGSTTCSLP